jgi:hypothetical protein
VIVGFTGSLLLARTPLPIAELHPLAGLEVELIGGRADGWQLAAITTELAQDTPGQVAALVTATTAPVLIAEIYDSDTALLHADSPEGHRWKALLNTQVEDGPWARPTACTETITAIADIAVDWAAEAGQTTTIEAVTAALTAADRDHRAADQAMRDAAGDARATIEIVRTQIPFIEVYVLRLLAVLGLATPVQNTGSWWAHLARTADTHTPK